MSIIAVQAALPGPALIMRWCCFDWGGGGARGPGLDCLGIGQSRYHWGSVMGYAALPNLAFAVLLGTGML